MPIVDHFEHRHAGHCESGASASLLRHYGFNLGEPLGFGLSSSLVFAHFPFLKVGGIPLTTYRMPPGFVINGLKKLGVKWKRHTYRTPEQAKRDLDHHLAAGRPVGMRASVYHLPYFPPEMRFHFNAHNLIVYGRDGDEYLISDPVFEEPQRCPVEALSTARFVKGKFAPKGLIYYPTRVPSDVDYTKAAKRAFRRTTHIMLYSPVPWVGVKAIGRMANTIRRLGNARDPRYGRLLIGSVIRMQEEIGTGGGGFRYMYASFLEELAEKTGNAQLPEFEQRMTAIGDDWRQFALTSSRYLRKPEKDRLEPIALQLEAVADAERAFFQDLRKFKL